MSSLEYLRPTTLQEAVALLNRPGRHTVPLAGGGWLVPRLRTDVAVPNPLTESVDAVVDLADLGLGAVELDGEPGHGWLHLGATLTLSQLADDEACRALLADGLLVQAAHSAAPLNQRNTATLAGTLLGADSANELLLLLLALGAKVEVADATATHSISLLQLAELPAGGLITRISLPWPTQAAHGSLARIARTPTDEPIVAAAAVHDGNRHVIAIGGVCAVPLLLNAGDSLDILIDGQTLRDDWQGSADYRRAMANVLMERVRK